MKKATVRILGGLGNQMHCYAFGRAYSIIHDVPLYLDVTTGFKNDIFGREYLLGSFENLNEIIHEVSPTINIERIKKLLPSTMNNYIYEADRGYYYQHETLLRKHRFNPCFVGYWSSYRYIDDIKSIIQNDLKPTLHTNTDEVNEVLESINNNNSCFIHYRSYEEDPGSKRYLDSYYTNAIQLMKDKFSNLKFFIFSDSAIQARTFFKSLDDNFFYVDLDKSKGNYGSLIDFYLMYKCKHSIIGNSSFSWWSALLSDYGNKEIIYPYGLSPWGEDWAPQSWSKIHVSV